MKSSAFLFLNDGDIQKHKAFLCFSGLFFRRFNLILRNMLFSCSVMFYFFCNPIDDGPPGASVHRFSQTRISECCFLWKWQPTPVFLPGESQGWGSLMGCRLWGRTESDTTEVT